jgi:alpha-galactosidase
MPRDSEEATMNILKRAVVPAIFLLSLSLVPLLGQAAGSVPLTDGWKFMPGDDPAYAQPALDDAKWQPIRADKIWEDQGYEKLDGFAWYRLKVVIPSSLKRNDRLHDGLRIDLGKINNFDQSFLNGQVFGINGQAVPGDTPIDATFTKADSQLYNTERVYVLPVDDPRILWDKENVIAVRVFDEGGQGGLWSGNESLRMVAIGDYLACDSASRSFVFQNGKFFKTFTIRNTSDRHAIKGTLTINVRNKLTGAEVSRTTDPVSLRAGASLEFSVGVDTHDQAGLVSYDFTFDGGETWSAKDESPYVLTPPPPAQPRITGAAVYSARPGHPFLYTVAATGERPLTFSAAGLPEGLSLDPSTGIITGRCEAKGEYAVALTARNTKGEARRTLKIIIGDQVALTPPMGWNSWNCWGLSVSADKVYASARVFKDKGLMDHGWAFINIDDGWEIKGDSPDPKRDPQGRILTNEKFKDMKGLGDKIHALGLKFGIYSSPGPLTCGGYTASYQHELQDAQSWASWGIDYVKYDWCSYEQIAKNSTREELMKPYLVMRRALDQVDRDIVFSLCQYGMGKVWEWGAEVGGNLWRTTGDITDTWESLRDIGFSQVADAPYAGPGHWNDPDMLVVGWVGWGPSLHPTHLTPDEQYTHISLWCLLSAPLLIGCDLERLDEFTLGLLTNDEVLALDQDPAGRQAAPKVKAGNIQVWVKELADGGRAVGIFNLGENSEKYALDLKALGCAAKAKVRDLWRQKDLGEFSDTFEASVPARGVVLVKLGAQR